MGQLYRKDFTRGWMPSADSVNCPKNALLRADNCVLDELGVLAVRPGSSKINGTALADTNIHSLFTAHLSGTRYRMTGAAADIYSNGTSLSQTMAGTGDVAFGSGMGQIFAARSTSKIKYDGTTVRNWGIAQPSAAPTVAAKSADSKTFSTCASADYANWTQNEGTKSDQTTYIQLISSTTTARGTITKDFGSAQDFTTYDGSGVGTDRDIFQFYFLITEPQLLEYFTVTIDVNDGTFTDYYTYTWERDTGFIDTGVYGSVPLSFNDWLNSTYAEQFLAEDLLLAVKSGDTSTYDAVQAVYQQYLDNFSTTSAAIKSELSSTEFNIISILRSSFARVGITTGKNWSTVRAIRLTIGGSATITTGFKTIQLIGGSTRQLTGKYKYRYVFVRTGTDYYAISKPSSISAEIQFKTQAAEVTIPTASLSAMDSQVNAIWVYRTGGVLDDWYRVATSTDVTDPVVIDDTVSDIDALIINKKLDTDIDVPPDNIIDITGMHYDRIYVLTSSGFLYPSKKLNVDGFAASEAIRVCGSDETPYWVDKIGQELYVGTSGDIYRISGTGAQYQDKTLDFTKIPLGIGSPPVSVATAREGNILCYLASDGWRLFTGLDSQDIRGDTDLLWRGYTRHGVSDINIDTSTARFRGAISKGVLTVITPEGSDTTSSDVLYRYNFARQRYYRHTYTPTFQCIHREPDGTLIAGDSSGFVWTLDTGTQDDSNDIPVIVWTGVDDNDYPYTNKIPLMHRVRLDTGGDDATINIHFDGSTTTSKTITASATTLDIVETDCSELSAFKQIQHRITGSFSTFKLMDLWIDYKDRPIGRKVLDVDINTGNQSITWIRQIRIKALAGGSMTVTPYFDGTAKDSYTATPSNTTDPEVIEVPVGRECKGKAPRIRVTSDYEFFPYWISFRFRGSGNVTGKQYQRIDL